MDLHQRRRVALIVIAFLVGLHFGQRVEAGPVIKVGDVSPTTKRVPIDRISHAEWDRLLRKYVDASGDVDYAGWKNSASDRRALEEYLHHLSRADWRAKATRGASLAYWINAYNALTIHGVLREFPTSSIRNHTATLFGYNIWKDLKLTNGSRAFSLEDIEHKILRKAGDPRIHFAIVCASRSCPRLLPAAYSAKEVDAQLARNTREFFSNRKHFQHDAQGGVFRVSSILKWFAEDFGKDQRARLRWIAPHLPTAADRAAAESGKVSLTYLKYDWKLNDQATARRILRRSHGQ